MKNHSRHLYVPFCVIFAPHSVDVARYASFIWHKSPTNCDVHLTESIFQTRSGIGSGRDRDHHIRENRDGQSGRHRCRCVVYRVCRRFGGKSIFLRAAWQNGRQGCLQFTGKGNRSPDRVGSLSEQKRIGTACEQGKCISPARPIP